ncbi:hypothetical protein Tco_1299755 [Tanacetum coccineum]
MVEVRKAETQKPDMQSVFLGLPFHNSVGASALNISTAATVCCFFPYSDFLSKDGGNQVQKVEVDGVHIMFTLKQDVGGMKSDVSGSGVSKMQIVYTTTRPNDIKNPYEKMLENDVEFGAPNKRFGGFLNYVLVSSFVI